MLGGCGGGGCVGVALSAVPAAEAVASSNKQTNKIHSNSAKLCSCCVSTTTTTTDISK